MRCDPAACAYAFLESAPACARGYGEASTANSTKASAFFLVASLRPPNLLDRGSEGRSPVDARGTKINALSHLVQTASNDHRASRDGARFRPKSSAIGILRGLKSACYTRGMGNTNFI